MVARYRARLLRKGYNIKSKAPFVDYRPDVCAHKKKEKVFAEIEIQATLHSEHTLGQLNSMYTYIKKSKNYRGLLIVPTRLVSEAKFLIMSVFGDRRIEVEGL